MMLRFTRHTVRSRHDSLLPVVISLSLLWPAAVYSQNADGAGSAADDATATTVADANASLILGELLREAMQASNVNYTSAVVVPMLDQLVNSALSLESASTAFEEEPTTDTLKQLRQQLAETALLRAAATVFDFGPIHSQGYAAAMDTPADAAGLRAIVSADQSDAARIQAASNQPWMQGFDALNQLLSDDEGLVSSETYTDIERAYIRLLASRLRETTQNWRDSWTESSDGRPAYQTILATAGETENPFYLTVHSAAEEIVRGVINTLAVEVGESLPALQQAESEFDAEQFAGTVAQSRAVLLGAVASYAGQPLGMDVYARQQPEDAAAAGLSQWVGQYDSKLNNALHAQLSSAIDDITRLTKSFNQDEPSVRAEKLTAVQSSMSQVLDMLEAEVLPLTKTSLAAN